MKPRCLQRVQIIPTGTFTCYNLKMAFDNTLFFTNIALHHFMKKKSSNILSQNIIRACRLNQ